MWLLKLTGSHVRVVVDYQTSSMVWLITVWWPLKLGVRLVSSMAVMITEDMVEASFELEEPSEEMQHHIED